MNTVSTRISDRINRPGSVTITGIRSSLDSAPFPSIYIETDREIEINNGILRIGNSSYPIIDKTTIEVVKILRDNDVPESYVASSKYEMTPAILLNNFSNIGFITSEVNQSPLNISEIHDTYIENIVNINHANITKEIISVYDNDQAVLFSNDTEQNYHYYREGDLLFVNNLTEQTKLITKYSIEKFFLMSSYETVLNLKDLISRSDLTPQVITLLNIMNSNNKDIA